MKSSFSSEFSSFSNIEQAARELKKKDEREQRISKCIAIVFGILPIVIMIGIFLMFSLNDSMKHRVVGMFTSMQARGIDGEIACYLLGYGALLVFLSFPYVIFEMSLGFTFPVPQALFFAIAAKLLGEIVCYVISKFLLKSVFLKFLRMNDHFRVIEAAVKKFPWTVSHLLRASILVPLFVINFGSGIIDLTFGQYIIPAILWGTLYSIFSVLCGSQLVSIQEVIDNAAFPKNKMMFIFEISMLAMSLVIIVAAIWKSGRLYDQIKAELEEEDTAKLSNDHSTNDVYFEKYRRFSDISDAETCKTCKFFVFSAHLSYILIPVQISQRALSINYPVVSTRVIHKVVKSEEEDEQEARTTKSIRYQQFYKNQLDKLPVTSNFTVQTGQQYLAARSKSFSLEMNQQY